MLIFYRSITCAFFCLDDITRHPAPFAIGCSRFAECPISIPAVRCLAATVDNFVVKHQAYAAVRDRRRHLPLASVAGYSPVQEARAFP